MKIKKEPGAHTKAKTEGEKPAPPSLTPWAVKVKREKGDIVASAETANDILPWKVPAPTSTPPPPIRRERREGVTPARVQRLSEQDGRVSYEPPAAASWELDTRLDTQGDRLVCIKNYSAVETTKGSYGLIDRGVQEVGLQTLIMHTPRGKRKADGRQDSEEVRPGSILRVSSTRKGGRDGSLRVRFVTPARYYTPGSKVTTMCIGVDLSDWLDLMTQRHRI